MIRNPKPEKFPLPAGTTFCKYPVNIRAGFFDHWSTCGFPCPTGSDYCAFHNKEMLEKEKAKILGS